MKNVRVTWLGVATLALLASALVLAIWGSGAVKEVGVAVLVLVIAMLTAQGVADRSLDDPETRHRDAKKRRFDREE
jgi:hypothetical protein